MPFQSWGNLPAKTRCLEGTMMTDTQPWELEASLCGGNWGRPEAPHENNLDLAPSQAIPASVADHKELGGWGERVCRQPTPKVGDALRTRDHVGSHGHGDPAAPLCRAGRDRPSSLRGLWMQGLAPRLSPLPGRSET